MLRLKICCITYSTICPLTLQSLPLHKTKRYAQILQISVAPNWGLALKKWNYEPSSKLCSNCGYRHSEFKLSDRYWECPDCGARHDRDFNAAVNIKGLGLSLVGMVLGDLKYSPTASGFNRRGGEGYEADEASKCTMV